MLKKEKAPAGARGEGQIKKAGSLVSPPSIAESRLNCKPWISGPLDLAIAQIEHHRTMARYHYGEVLKHKLIKLELENLAFGGEL